MERLLIPGSASGNTKAVLEAMDGFFHIYTYFISGVPFSCTADCARISTKVFLRIDIKHSPAGRCSTRVITVTDTAFGFVRFVVFPPHFRADKFHGWKSAPQLGSVSLPFHCQGRVIGTTGDAFVIYGVACAFAFKLVFQRDICFFKRGFL